MLEASARDRAVFFHGPEALVLADLHVGRDAASSVEVPLGERRLLTERLDSLLSAFDPATVVFAGDVLDRFDRLPRGAAETVTGLRETCLDAGATPEFVAGNHDAMLGSVLDDPPRDAHRLADGTLVCHGHEAPDRRAERYVIGHDHPALVLDGRRRPCYLYGEGAYRGGDLLVVPAATPLAPGTPVNRARPGDFQSPMIDDLGVLRPVVCDPESAETLSFPPLADLREHL